MDNWNNKGRLPTNKKREHVGIFPSSVSPDLIQKYTSDKLAQIQKINQQKWLPHSTDGTCRAGSSHILCYQQSIAKLSKKFSLAWQFSSQWKAWCCRTCATDKVRLMKYEIFLKREKIFLTFTFAITPYQSTASCTHQQPSTQPLCHCQAIWGS